MSQPPVDEPPEALIGRRLGHYLVLDAIGGGAMGHVFRARDVVLRRTVALKVHKPRRGSSGLGRFHQEGRAVLALGHPGIAEVYETGQSGPYPYLAMELVDGPTLADLLRHGGLGWAVAASLARDIAEALGHAHRHGVVHRDLKPSNVLVSRTGVVKLVDFGLAKQIAMPEPGEQDATVYEWSEVHTADGAVLGTPAYMSPEQARARPVDARADVFSLGTLVHELVTGVAIFRRASPAATIGAILASKPPRLDAIDARVPAWLADVVQRSMAKEPEERFEDGGALALALEAAGVERVELSRIAQEASAERISLTRTSRPSLRPASLVPAPRPSTRFIGRAAERRWLLEAAVRGEPVVVVHGPAGSGKSRLVREHLEERGEDDAFVVDLALATSDALAVHAVAAAIGASRPDRIGARLAQRESPRLVLDGQTRSTEGLLALARAWSERAPRARFVIVGEAPPAGPTPAIAVEGLPPEEACELLLERLMSSADDPPRVLNQREVALRVAEHVAGNPLALEIVARLAATGEPADLARLEASMRDDDATARTASSDTGSRASGAWVALAAAERTLAASELEALAALAVVPAFDLAAAAAITGLGHEAAEAWLARLQHLGLAYPAPHPELLGVPRWALREVVRRRMQRGSSATGLDPGLRARALRRAAKHYAVHAHARREAIRSAPAREAHREVALDEAAVLAVADATIEDPTLGLDGLALDALVAQVEGRPASSSSLLFLFRLDALITRALEAESDADIVLDAIVARATLRLALGANDARDDADRALSWALRRDDAARLSRARTLMARALLTSGELDAAGAEAERAVDDARAAAPPAASAARPPRDPVAPGAAVERGAELGAALEVLAEVALERGTISLARTATDEARRLAIAREDAAARLRAVVLAASVARESTDPDAERACLEEALELSRAFGLVERTAAILLELGEVEHRVGAVARALDLLTQAAALHPESEATADALRLAAAALAVERGDLTRASALASIAESDPESAPLALAIAGGARAALGELEPARRLFARALDAEPRDAVERAAIELWRGHLDMLEQPGEAGIQRASARVDGLRVGRDPSRPGSRHALAIALRVLEARLPRRASLVP